MTVWERLSGHHSEESLKNYIGHPLSEQLRACSDNTAVCIENKVCFENWK